MKRTNHLPLSQYENKLETIQEEYLQKHFQQITIVLSKNYHYGFQIIKYLWKLQTNKSEKGVRIIVKNIQQIIDRRKMFVISSIMRKQHEIKYLKSKSCIFITSILTSIKHLFKGKLLDYQFPFSNPSKITFKINPIFRRKNIFFY